MTRAVMAVLFLLYCAACDGSASAGISSASRASEPPAAILPAPSLSEIRPSAKTTPPVPEPTTPERPPALRVAPRTLAVSWQAYLGRHVSLACRPVRRIDFVRTLVVADGARFVVMGPPELVPCAATTSMFTVVGSTSVAISGRTVLPELLLEKNSSEDGAR